MYFSIRSHHQRISNVIIIYTKEFQHKMSKMKNCNSFLSLTSWKQKLWVHSVLIWHLVLVQILIYFRTDAFSQVPVVITGVTTYKLPQIQLHWTTFNNISFHKAIFVYVIFYLKLCEMWNIMNQQAIVDIPSLI